MLQVISSVDTSSDELDTTDNVSLTITNTNPLDYIRKLNLNEQVVAFSTLCSDAIVMDDHLTFTALFYADSRLKDIYLQDILKGKCDLRVVALFSEVSVDIKKIKKIIKSDSKPLIESCLRGYTCIVDLLIQLGANVNAAGQTGNTPLISACENNYIRIVYLLIKSGADVNAQDKLGFSPLIVASSFGYIDTVDMLIKAGAKVNIGLNVNTGRIVNSPLIRAAFSNHNNIVERLIKAGADVNFCDDFNVVPLLYIMRRDNVETVKLLIKAKADITFTNNQGWTLLMFAINQGQTGTFELLIKEACADL